MKAQAQFSLCLSRSDALRPREVMATGAALHVALADIERRGGIVEGLAVGRTPGEWKLRIQWPAEIRFRPHVTAKPGSPMLP